MFCRVIPSAPGLHCPLCINLCSIISNIYPAVTYPEVDRDVIASSLQHAAIEVSLYKRARMYHLFIVSQRILPFTPFGKKPVGVRAELR